MRHQHFKIVNLVLATVISAICFGQTKTPLPVQNFVNPFKSKTIQKSLIVTASGGSDAATSTNPKEMRIETLKGSFHRSLTKHKVSKEEVSRNFNSWLGLNEKHTFQQVRERTDELGFTHINYQQLFNGIPIDGCIIMTHFKNGVATSVNGQVAEFSEIELTQSIDTNSAIRIAKEFTKTNELINTYPVTKLIARLETEAGITYRLAYRVRIDAMSPFTMCYVYVDAANGKVINKIELITHADTPGTASTLYSGTQSITCDSDSGRYRLRESSRKIETYDATNATGLTTSGFTGVADYRNASTSWGIPTFLTSFTISSIAQSWWYTSFADESPDLYLKIRNGANQLVYNGQGAYINNTHPSVTFNNLNILLINPPYTVEIWDYDAVGGDDFGGSYTVLTSTGTQFWSGSGNTGSYNIVSISNPALDVHWGMEKTYDFYLSVFGRNSYDGNGSVIRNYINDFTKQLIPGCVKCSPNGASALNPPYNIMSFGLGDGQTMNPVVGLDVEGHEYTHMVVNHIGNSNGIDSGLVYMGESGALNESFADIFGTCVEFYAGVNPDWIIGESIIIQTPYYLRSMSNPKSGGNCDICGYQPNTFQGQYWTNPSNLQDDNGGVHKNSGVQNYWFFLLSQGGSDVNDIGNTYSVSGIGITQARQIAYRNLSFYLGPNATYYDSYLGSLQAAEDLYGNPSTQYNAVRAAWYAVGIGSNPTAYCSGTTDLTASSGTFSDGSGSANYLDNAYCKWVIAPPGATQINLTFSSFALENGYDTVFIYGGTDTTVTPLTYTGTSLPPPIQTPVGVGAMLIIFKSDINTNASGWTASYTSTGITPTCDGGTVLTNPTGTFNDGSGGGNYGNNQFCYWYIAPPCANSVTLSFSAFNTESGYDGLVIYDDLEGTNQLAVLTGTSIPTPVTSTTGKMLVIFVSDYLNVMQGFTGNYTSTGSAYCSGTTTLNSSDWGTLTDGSGANNYCSNLDCRWLIQPPQATSVTLNFTEFDLEAASPDGQTIYDAVEIYDGTTTAAALLGRFSGSNLPPAITSTGGSMLIRFYSDLEVVKQGWSAYYTSTSNPYCNSSATLTAASGTFSDGSGANQYANNSSCSWLIQPTNAASITLTFSAFDTELNYDGVIVYDGANNSSPVLGQFSGTSIPSSVTSTGGSMFIEFLSDPAQRGNGWTANYTSTTGVSSPLASFSTNNTNLCPGNCINFSDNSTNSPTSWSWAFTGGAPSSSTTQNPTNICYNTAGTYNVSLTATNSGGSNTKTMNGYITVNPAPTAPTISVSPSNSICQGETATLTISNPCAGCTFSWSPNSQTGTSIQVSTGNNYSVNAINSCGQVSSNLLSVIVNSLPPTPIATINGNQLESSSAVGNQWYFNGSLISGATQQTYAPQQSGNYYVVVTDGNGCSSGQSNTVSFIPTGIGNIDVPSVVIYPNPTTGELNILFSSNQTDVTIELFDMTGKQIMWQAVKDASVNHIENINLSAFPNGIYNLRLKANTEVSFHRIVLTN